MDAGNPNNRPCESRLRAGTTVAAAGTASALGRGNRFRFASFVTHLVVVAVYVSVNVSVTCFVEVAPAVVIAVLETLFGPITEEQKELTAAFGELFAIDWIRGLTCGIWQISANALSLRVGRANAVGKSNRSTTRHFSECIVTVTTSCRDLLRL